MTLDLWQGIVELAAQLTAAEIPYTFVGPTALFVQGVDVPDLDVIAVAIQWDMFDRAQSLYGATEVDRDARGAWFQTARHGRTAEIFCRYNTVIVTDPDRIRIAHGDAQVWAKSLESYRRHAEPGDPLVPRISQLLAERQRELGRHNGAAWSQGTYEAWVERHGQPSEAAAYIQADPSARLAPLYRYLLPLQGRRVVNLLGSHGSKAIAMALLGSQVTVVDISPENRRYAMDVASAAGVAIRYVVADVLDLPPGELSQEYDLVLMEIGILHYFVDLAPLAAVIAGLLRPGGRLVLQDFHPFSTKLITSRGKKHKVTGNYFDPALAAVPVAYSKYLSGGGPTEVWLRRWTLGEIVTAVAEAGLRVRLLAEEPNTKVDDIGIPKTFTLVAEKQ